MLHTALKFAHIIGALMLGGALVGVWITERRSRTTRDVARVAASLQLGAMLHQRLLLPGALVLFVSGSWLIAKFYGGWDFIDIPWLAGMVALYLIETVRGSTLGRHYGMRRGQAAGAALAQGRFTPKLEKALNDPRAAFAHFLELPLFLVMLALGLFRPSTWTFFFVGVALAVLLATALAAFAGKPAAMPKGKLAGNER